jgi:hypothetical protein
MKKILLTFLISLVSLIGFSQACPSPSPSGVYVILDTNYQLSPMANGSTDVRMCFYNNTTNLITATQFRVFYDNVAFSSVSNVTSLNTSFAQYLQFVDNPAGGYVTITMTYTGNNVLFEIPDGPLFKLTMVYSPTYPTLTSISPMSFVGVNTYNAVSTTQAGMDNSLTLFNAGGNFLPQLFSYHGRFKNVTGTGSKNLTIALEKKLESSSTWTQVTTVLTDNTGKFTFTNIPVDTSSWDVRIKIQGDTLLAGNVISVADAQKINQYILGTSTPSGFDYYSSDVNGDNNLSISDAYGVFGRVSGRFSQWPNSVKDIKFFTSNEYSTINASSTNYLSTIPGVTNFTFEIVAGQPDSVTYYVLVPGDANGTGYHMARATPIEILINPSPGVESQIYNVIDETVEYDFPTSQIEVNVPRLSVDEGNLLNIPVKVLTNGVDLGSLQFGFKYNDLLLEFKGIDSKSATAGWITYLNTNDSQVDWGGYDNTSLNPIQNGDEIVTLQFLAKKPQNEWNESPIWTTNKFASDEYCKDLEITPTNGIVQVYKIATNGKLDYNEDMLVFPNPTDDFVNVKFKVVKGGDVTLSVYGLDGNEYVVIVNDVMPIGEYQYSTSLGFLPAGEYIAVLKRTDKKISNKILLK